MTEPANDRPKASNESAPEHAPEASPRSRFRFLLGAVASTLLTVGVLVVLAGRLYLYDSLSPLPAASPGEEPGAETAKEIRGLEAEARRARRSVAVIGPHTIYVVVDTAGNRIYVKRGDEVLHEAVCSTGSGGLLKDPENDREWVFETPRGFFTVVRKAEDPVWTKPDWAFVEEGKPIPQRWSERRDYDTLGDYALYFGDGYMIHGTLYQRYLGRSITHGCVRLGDEDLERVYRMTPLGAPILIF